MVQAAELSLTAPQVVALRTTRMLTAGPYPGARDRRELTRMVAEKTQAWHESMNAVIAQMHKAHVQWLLSAMHSWLALWMSPWLGLGHGARLPFPASQAGAAGKRLHRTASKVIGSGLAPVHRRVTANARRLGRARR